MERGELAVHAFRHARNHQRGFKETIKIGIEVIFVREECNQPFFSFPGDGRKLGSIRIDLIGGILAALNQPDEDVDALIGIAELCGEELDLRIQTGGDLRILRDEFTDQCLICVGKAGFRNQIHGLQVIRLIDERTHIVVGKDGQKIHRAAEIRQLLFILLGQRANFLLVRLGKGGFSAARHDAV